MFISSTKCWRLIWSSSLLEFASCLDACDPTAPPSFLPPEPCRLLCPAAGGVGVGGAALSCRGRADRLPLLSPGTGDGVTRGLLFAAFVLLPHCSAAVMVAAFAADGCSLTCSPSLISHGTSHAFAGLSACTRTSASAFCACVDYFTS